MSEISSPTSPSAGDGFPQADRLRAAITAELPRIFDQLSQIVAFPSVHNLESQACTDAAAWVVESFRAEGIADAHSVITADGSPAVFGLRPARPGKPTVLLYSHFDVQPAGDLGAWTTSPWTLTERAGRWYGRGAADDKGNLVLHLAVLRVLNALGLAQDIGIRIVCEGSEEQGGAGLEHLVQERPELTAAEAILIADTGNIAKGQPTLNTSLRGAANVKVTLETLGSAVHSGMYGGAAPDALGGLIGMLATLKDAHGNTTIDALDASQTWAGVQYDAQRFAADADVLPGVTLPDGGTVAELTWARPTVTVTALDAPPTDAPINAIAPSAAAVLNLRIPPGTNPVEAQDKLVAHLERRVPWNARFTAVKDAVGYPFLANTGGEVHTLLSAALTESYGRETVSSGEGASIPLCQALIEAHPTAQIALFGVEEPLCRIHAPNESVDPEEILHIALAEALFLSRYGS